MQDLFKNRPFRSHSGPSFVISENSRWANLENRMEFERNALQSVAKQVARDIASASDRMESIEKLRTKDQAVGELQASQTGRITGELQALIDAADKAFDDAVEKSLKIAESIEKWTKEQQVDASK